MQGELPLLLGEVRRGRRIAQGTWEGWDTRRGHRLLLQTGPVRPVPGVLPMTPSLSGRPHLRSGPIEATLADFLPLDDEPDTAWLGGIVAGTLRALQALHEAGEVHGALGPELIVCSEGRWTLAWTGADAGDRDEDLRALGHLIADIDPVGILAGALDDEPPPSAADAGRLVRRALASELTSRHNELVERLRRISRARRVAGLGAAMRRLVAASPPPRAHGCVRASLDGVVHLVASDGVTVRGGATATTATGHLPLVWSEGRLEVQQARLVLRAWTGRARGDEERRARAQVEMGGDDLALAALVRWLAAAARLRTDTLLLEGAR